jgi:hypothetical protein
MAKGASYRSLALSLLGDVRTQWSTLCPFLDSFYIKLTGVANFPKEKAWKLTGRCVAAIFTAMGSYRASVSRLDDMVNLENKASCMWGSYNATGWCWNWNELITVDTLLGS